MFAERSGECDNCKNIRALYMGEREKGMQYLALLNEEREVTGRYIEDLRKLAGFRQEVETSVREFKPTGGYRSTSQRASELSKASFDKAQKKKEVGPPQSAQESE